MFLMLLLAPHINSAMSCHGISLSPAGHDNSVISFGVLRALCYHQAIKVRYEISEVLSASFLEENVFPQI